MCAPCLLEAEGRDQTAERKRHETTGSENGRDNRKSHRLRKTSGQRKVWSSSVTGQEAAQQKGQMGMRLKGRTGRGLWPYKDGQEEREGKATGADAHIRVVGAKEQGYEDHHIEARQCPDALRRPAHTLVVSHD